MAERWLVIDDSSTIQRVIKLAFQDYDVIISEADSCPEAMREIARIAPTLVIADAAVAGVQSVQDFVNLRNQAPQTPFVIIEGSYDNIDATQFRTAGFSHFLKKPFDASQILAVTRQALGRALPYRQTGMPVPPPPPPMARQATPASLPRSTAEESFASPMKAADLGTGSFDLGLNDLRSSQPPQPKAPPQTMAAAPQPQSPTGVRRDSKANEPTSFLLDDNEATEQPPIQRWGESSSSTKSFIPVLEPMLKEELERWVKGTVEEYCRKHFPAIARELISRELERLTQERARLLVDK